MHAIPVPVQDISVTSYVLLRRYSYTSTRPPQQYHTSTDVWYTSMTCAVGRHILPGTWHLAWIRISRVSGGVFVLYDTGIYAVFFHFSTGIT